MLALLDVAPSGARGRRVCVCSGLDLWVGLLHRSGGWCSQLALVTAARSSPAPVLLIAYNAESGRRQAVTNTRPSCEDLRTCDQKFMDFRQSG